jgi:hypothetical protein
MLCVFDKCIHVLRVQSLGVLIRLMSTLHWSLRVHHHLNLKYFISGECQDCLASLYTEYCLASLYTEYCLASLYTE